MCIFVESRMFTKRIKEFLTDGQYRRLQNRLMANPDLGAVMPGCGGLRKLRHVDKSRNKGARGGCRIIYLNVPEAKRIDLIAIYGKDEQDDLNTDQKKALKKLAEAARKEARLVKATRRR